jgi:hypothetical protein
MALEHELGLNVDGEQKALEIPTTAATRVPATGFSRVTEAKMPAEMLTRLAFSLFGGLSLSFWRSLDCLPGRA